MKTHSLIKTQSRGILAALAVLLLAILNPAPGRAQSVTSYWANSAGGDFTNSVNWANSTVPGISDLSEFTNNASYTVSMSASVTNASVFFTPLGGNVLLDVTAGNTWFVTNRFNVASAALANNVSLILTNAGSLVATNVLGTANIYLGLAGVGTLSQSNGNVLVRQIYLGYNSKSLGTLNMAGGTNIISSWLSVGGISSATATGIVSMTGGQLVITNSGVVARIGELGAGIMTQSGGDFLVNGLGVGVGAGGGGTFTMSGGTTLDVGTANFQIGVANHATGTVVMTGGQMVFSNAAQGTYVAAAGGAVGTLTQSNGNFLTKNLYIGYNNYAVGTFNMAGGTNTVFADVAVGVNQVAATGAVVMTGGQLVATNGSGLLYLGHTGVGTVTQSGGDTLFNGVTMGFGAGASATWNMSAGTNFVGAGIQVGALANSTGTVVMTGGQWVNTNAAAYLYVGSAGVGTLILSNGTILAQAVRVGAAINSMGNLQVAGGLLQNAGVVYVGTNGVSLGTGAVLVTGNGILESIGLVSGLNGSGTISNRGGVYQFATGAPTITANTANSIVLTNGIVSFRGVANAAVNGQITNITYQGANTLRLDSSTNAAGLASFTVGGAGNYAQLELAGANSLWQSTNLTVGAGGAVIANASAQVLVLGTYQNLGSSAFSNLYTVASGSRYQSWGGSTNQFVGGLMIASGGGLDVTNGQSLISGTITNDGTMTVMNSRVTYGGPVVISGGYISDPSTNIYVSNLTVTPGGYLQGSNGDLFVFNQDFINQSTNRSQFNLAYATVLFTNAANHSFDLTGSGALDKGSNWLNVAQLATNFSIGTLSIASNNNLTVTGGHLTNALYVGWLDLQGVEGYTTNQMTLLTNGIVAALTLPNINLYYDKNLSGNTYLGGLEYNLWGGNGLLIPIPEPGSLALILVAAGCCGLAVRRIRHQEAP